MHRMQKRCAAARLLRGTGGANRTVVGRRAASLPWRGGAYQSGVFMKSLMVASLLVAAAIAPLGGAGAAERRGTVPAGKTTTVDAVFVFYEQVCLGGAVPDARLTKAPAHGKVTFTVGNRGFSDPKHPCYGKSYPGLVVQYTPDKGYRGEDSFSYRYTYDSDDGGGKSGDGSEVVLTVKQEGATPI